MAVAAEVSSDPNFGMIGDGEIGLHHNAAAAVHLTTGGIGELAAEMGCAHASCPDHGRGLNADIAIRCADDHFPWTHGLYAAFRQEFDAVTLERFQRGVGQHFGHGPQNSVAGIDQDDPCLGWIQLFEGVVEGPAHQLGHGTGHFAAAGARTNDHDGLQKLPGFGIRRLFRLLHRHQQSSADLLGVLEDLHGRREGAPFVVTEKGAAGTRGQNQVVVAVGLAVENDLLAFGVDVGHLTQKHLNVPLLANQFAQWCGDVSSGHQTSRNLIQQRLKQVEIALVDQGDAHVGIGECFAGVHPGETAANNHHMGGMAKTFFRGFQFEKEVLTSHGFTSGRSRRVWRAAVFVRAPDVASTEHLESFNEQAIKKPDPDHLHGLIQHASRRIGTQSHGELGADYHHQGGDGVQLAEHAGNRCDRTPNKKSKQNPNREQGQSPPGIDRPLLKTGAQAAKAFVESRGLGLNDHPCQGKVAGCESR